MKPSRIVVAAALAVALALLTFTLAAYSSANDWAARVDGHAIGERGFLDELAELRENADVLSRAIPDLGASSEGTVPSLLASDVLNFLVQEAVAEQIAREQGVRPTPEQLGQAEEISIQTFGGEANWDRFSRWFRRRWARRQALLISVVRSEDDFLELLARVEAADIEVNPKYGTFGITFLGPGVVPPVPPQPPGRLLVRGGPGQDVAPGPFPAP